LKERFVAFAIPLKDFFELMTRSIVGIDNMIEKTIGWERAATILSVAVALLVAKSKPFVSALLMLGLATGDVMAYFEGSESMFGRFMEWISNANVFVKMLAATIGILGAVIASVFVVDTVISWGAAFVATMKSVSNALLAMNGMLKTPLGQLLLAIYGGVAIGKWLGDKIGEYGEKHSGEGGWSDKVGDFLLDMQNKIVGWDKNLEPKSNVNNTKINNNSINNNITINTTQPLKEITEEIVNNQDILNKIGAGM
jgi:hypothetical protein